MITLLLVHLHNHRIVAKKKRKNVQFHAELMDVVQTIGGGKRSFYDLDEIEEKEKGESSRKQD